MKSMLLAFSIMLAGGSAWACDCDHKKEAGQKTCSKSCNLNKCKGHCTDAQDTKKDESKKS